MGISTTSFPFAILLTALLIDAQQQVPCLFFYGDSQFDNGNNNALALATLARVNYQPYGIDFPAGPTGRFANGVNVPDTIAQLLGFPNPIPPYVATFGNPNITSGANYASGGAGILDETGSLLGARFTFNLQLLNHKKVVTRIASLLGSSTSSVINDYLTKCIYVVNIASNDYLNNYLLPNSPTRLFYSPDAFAKRLIERLGQQLRVLYNLGARKVAVFGVGLVGCVPQQIQAANAQGCVDSVNNIVRPFNDMMKPLIDNLNNQLTNAQFTFINSTNIALGDPSLTGIRVTTAPCCNVSATTGLCIPNSIPCSNRNEYSFWDNYHVTSLVNNATARRAYDAPLPMDASPVGIRGLVQ